MSLINENKNMVRTILLVIFIVSLLGPWGYDVIHVPAEYPCDLPNVRLYGDFCGIPIPWFGGVMLFAGDFFRILRELLTGAFTGRGRELLGWVLLILPSLPMVSTFFLLRHKDSARLQTFHLLAWGLGCAFSLYVLFLQPDISVFRLWGPWLFVGVAVSAFVLELRLRKRPPAENS